MKERRVGTGWTIERVCRIGMQAFSGGGVTKTFQSTTKSTLSPQTSLIRIPAGPHPSKTTNSLSPGLVRGSFPKMLTTPFPYPTFPKPRKQIRGFRLDHFPPSPYRRKTQCLSGGGDCLGQAVGSTLTLLTEWCLRRLDPSTGPGSGAGSLVWTVETDGTIRKRDMMSGRPQGVPRRRRGCVSVGMDWF